MTSSQIVIKTLIEPDSPFCTPEHKLAAAVLTRALVDYIQSMDGKTVMKRRFFKDVSDWIFDERNRNKPYSFHYICEMLAHTSDLEEIILTFLAKKNQEAMDKAASTLLSLGTLRTSFYTERRYRL